MSCLSAFGEHGVSVVFFVNKLYIVECGFSNLNQFSPVWFMIIGEGCSRLVQVEVCFRGVNCYALYVMRAMSSKLFYLL